MSTAKITLDLYTKNVVSVNAKQYDDQTRYIEITCVENGIVFTVDKSTMSAFVRLKKPDDNGVFNEAEVTSDGKLKIELTEQMLSASGRAIADVFLLRKVFTSNEKPTNIDDIYKINAPIISIMDFYINITPTALNHSQIESSYEFNALTNALAQIDFNNKKVVELDKTLTTNEDIRKQNETERKSNEESRINSEQKRVNEEDKRQKAEDIRVANENTRISNENTRQAQETKRQTDTAAAIDNANTATAEANKATAAAKTATTEAQTATAEAKTATAAANKAATDTTTAISNAKTATAEATKQAEAAKKTTDEMRETVTEAKTNATVYMSNVQTYVNTAKEYAAAAKTAADGISGALKPKGTVTFAQLPAITSVEAGSMYNISTEFTSTSLFKDGGNIIYPAGTNVYKTTDNFWDCLSGELSDYLMRADIDEAVEEAMPAYTASTELTELVTGESIKTAFGKLKTAVKNVITIAKLLGTTDISKIGGGTVTGAISTLNAKKATDIGGAPTSHASSTTTYGQATGTNYGHVKLSDTIGSSMGAANNGLAASQYAAYQLYIRIPKMSVSGTTLTITTKS